MALKNKPLSEKEKDYKSDNKTPAKKGVYTSTLIFSSKDQAIKVATEIGESKGLDVYINTPSGKTIKLSKNKDLKNLFSQLNNLNIIFNENEINEFIQRYPNSEDILAEISEEIRKKLDITKEVILKKDDDSERYLNFCIRQNNYKDLEFFKIISDFKNYSLDLLDNSNQPFNILIYTDYNSPEYIENVKNKKS